jgi:glycosyltransferase involved in cell wall biosynthesis
MFTNTTNGTIIGGLNQGTIIGSKPGNTISFLKNQPARSNKITPKTRPREVDMPRGLNYYADFSGCGFWRMVWPEHTLNAYQKAIVHGSTVMVTDEKYYTNVKCVRVQRQATPAQQKFMVYLKQLSEKMKFSIVYEIDDIVFYEDIPKYNKFRGAFVDESIRQATTEMMQMVDEITVTNQYMKDYYIDKTGNKNVTVIPNYPPRYWLDQYDENMIETNYSKRKKKPRVLYAGSGAHFDVDTLDGGKDDFHHVVDMVRKTVNKYQWVFIGAFPPPLRDLIVSGKIEFHQWCNLYDYPRLVKKIRPNVMVAPLVDNVFNKSKSDLKFVEGCALGLPTICQDMCTYEDAFFKFKTGTEMVDQIDAVMKDKGTYMKAVRRGRAEAEKRWLENPENIGKYAELYTLPYGDPKRVLLNSFNGL